jgi:hypothetical protein
LIRAASPPVLTISASACDAAPRSRILTSSELLAR